MYADFLVNMLLFLERNRLFDLHVSFIEKAKVNHLEFKYGDAVYCIKSIFSNDYWVEEAEEEYTDFHFYFEIENMEAELVYDRLNDTYIIQSIHERVLKLFGLNTYQGTYNYFFGNIDKSKISFIIEGVDESLFRQAL